MATTPEEFMRAHLDDFKKQAQAASPARRREMIEAIVLAASDVMVAQDLPHEPLSMLVTYIAGQPGDADLYRNLNAGIDTLHHIVMHHAEDQGAIHKALVLSSIMSNALCAATCTDQDEAFLSTSWKTLLEAMNLSNMVGGLPRFASAWQHRLLGGARAVQGRGFFGGSVGSA